MSGKVIITTKPKQIRRRGVRASQLTKTSLSRSLSESANRLLQSTECMFGDRKANRQNHRKSTHQEKQFLIHNLQRIYQEAQLFLLPTTIVL